MTLKEAVDQFLLNYGESTERAYRKTLEDFLAYVGPARPVAEVQYSHVAEWAQAVRKQKVKYATHTKRPKEAKPLKPSTVYKLIKTVKVFFNWCVKRKLIVISPAADVRNPRPSDTVRGRAATVEEMQAVINAAKDHPRDYAIVLLLARSGCRRGDVASLRIRDLDLDKNEAYVTGKGDKRRAIFFDDATSEAIQQWLQVRPKTNHDLVFTGEAGVARGKPLSGQAIRQITARRSEEAGLDRAINPHRFRHGVGTELAAQGVKLTAIQRYLGHSNPNTTLRYIEAVDKDMKEASEILGGRHAQKTRRKRRGHGGLGSILTRT